MITNRTHARLVVGLYELLDPITQLIEPPGPPIYCMPAFSRLSLVLDDPLDGSENI